MLFCNTPSAPPLLHQQTTALFFILSEVKRPTVFITGLLDKSLLLKSGSKQENRTIATMR
jgi:hypothetical protein